MAKQPGLAANPHAEISELRFQLEDKNTEISRLTLNLKASEDELTDTRRQLFEKKAEFNEAESKIMDLSADVGKWKSIANRGGGTGGGTDPQLILRKDSEIERLRKEVAMLNKKLEDTQEELQQERQRHGERRQSVPTEHYRVQIQHVQEDNTRLTGQVLSLQDELEQLKIDYRTLESRGGRGQGGGASFASLEEELIYYKREYERLRQNYKSLEDTNTAMHQQALIYEDDYKREKQEREEANARYQSAQDEIRKLKTTMHELHGSPPPNSPRGRPDEYTDSARGGGGTSGSHYPPQRYAHQSISHEDEGRDRLVTTNRSIDFNRYHGGGGGGGGGDYSSRDERDHVPYQRGDYARSGGSGDYYTYRSPDEYYPPQRDDREGGEGDRRRGYTYSSPREGGGDYSDRYHRNYQN